MILANTGKSDPIAGKNITINGGNITARGGEYAGAITASEKLLITGGEINVSAYNRWASSTLGGNTKEVQISGGTIKTISGQLSGISCGSDGKIIISGGNIYTKGKDFPIAKCINKERYDIEEAKATNGTNEVYETKIKLPDVSENKKITKLTTSDNINYGIKDMYTLEDGMLYLYLPTGTRTITIEVDGKTYSGEVQTTEIPVEVTLSEIN